MKHGFRRKRSTVSNLFQYLHEIYHFYDYSDKTYLHKLYFDFQEAFDK